MHKTLNKDIAHDPLAEEKTVGVAKDDTALEKEKPFFSLTSFPATCGDSFWLSYGMGTERYHILIDGGTSTVAETIKDHIDNLEADAVLELMVVTHYDSDHIEGIRSMLSENTLPITIKEVWFNDYKRLDPKSGLEKFGAEMAEKLSAEILRHEIPWNVAFNGAAVMASNEKPEELPSVTLRGGMKLTLLSPYQKQLTAVKAVWEEELEEKKLVPGFGTDLPPGVEQYGPTKTDFDALGRNDFNPDRSEGNGSSIAFLAEFAGRCVLFSGDAFSEVIIQSLDHISHRKVDLLKISHHGGKRNTDPDLIKQIDCRHFLFSTNGTQRPTAQTMAYILLHTNKPVFHFNYAEQKGGEWEGFGLKSAFGYSTRYPEQGHLVIDIMELKIALCGLIVVDQTKDQIVEGH